MADFRKYSDTVAISSAILHLFEENPSLGHFIGIEHTLHGSSTPEVLTPDITVTYDNDTIGLLFELKYSLPSDVRSVKDELLKLSKYATARDGWGVRSPVQAGDFVLVCHADDVKRTVEAATEISSETSNPFFSPRSFSVRYWTITAPRNSERKEEMRLLHAYGATGNNPLQSLINQAGGVVISEDVLTSLRFTNVFVTLKTPSSIFDRTFDSERLFGSSTYSKSRGETQIPSASRHHLRKNQRRLPPPWWESTTETVQVERSWIKEALDNLVNLKVIERIQGTDSYSIPIPTVVARKATVAELICKKLERLRRGRTRTVLPKPVKRGKGGRSGDRSITDFFGNRR